MAENIDKKKLARWPVVFADYQEAKDGQIKPVPKEVFLDYQNQDAYFYDPAGYYVSIVSLIRSGLVQTWMAPCVSYDAILAKYPDPPLSTVCAAADTGIIYEYVGNGKWIPVGSNSIPLASSTTNGLMSSQSYDRLNELYDRTNLIVLGYNESAPLPKDRVKNTFYAITTAVIADRNDREYEKIEPVDSKTIKEDWPYDQLWDYDPETGELYEIVDPLFLIVKSESQVKAVEVPEGYSNVYYLVPSGKIVEDLEEVEFTYNAYPSDWPYDKLFDVDKDGKTYIITDPGYLTVSSDADVVPVEPQAGVSAVYYQIPKDAETIRDEGIQLMASSVEA